MIIGELHALIILVHHLLYDHIQIKNLKSFRLICIIVHMYAKLTIHIQCLIYISLAILNSSPKPTLQVIFNMISPLIFDCLCELVELKLNTNVANIYLTSILIMLLKSLMFFVF